MLEHLVDAKLDLAVTADLVEDRFFQPLLDGGMQQARLLVVGRGVARAEEGRCLVHVAERGDPGPELLVEDFIVERERQAGRNDQIARVANRLGMQQARIDIGGEQHAVGKGGAQRLPSSSLSFTSVPITPIALTCALAPPPSASSLICSTRRRT